MRRFLRVFPLFVVAATYASFASYAAADVSLESEFHLAEQLAKTATLHWESQLELAMIHQADVEHLSSAGHASWIELARQRARVERVRAHRDASLEMVAFIARLKLHANPAPATRQTVHAVRLYQPASVRLIGWFDVETIPVELAASLPAAPSQPLLPSELADAVAQVDEQQSRVAKMIEAGYAEHSRRLRIARQRLAAAESGCELLRLQHQYAQSERDVHEALKNRSSTSVHSRTVGPWASVMLGLSTRGLVQLERSAHGQRRVAELKLRKSRLHRDAVLELFSQGHASRREVQRADESYRIAETELRQLVVDESDPDGEMVEVEDANGSNKGSAQTADDHYWLVLAKTGIRHPTALRHMIQMRRERLAQRSDRHAKSADLHVLEETCRRMIAAKLEHEPGRREREQIDLDLQLARAQLAAMDERGVILALEEQRFVRYLLPVLQNPSQPTRQWNATSLTVAGAAVTRVMSGGLFANRYHRPSWPTGYLEASIVDPVSLCLPIRTTCEEQCEEDSFRRLERQRGHGPIEWASDGQQLTTMQRPAASILVSQFDLQRLCSFYCDLPGSSCPTVQLGPQRLFASLAVPVARGSYFQRHDDWRGIRTVSYARVAGERYVLYPGIRGFPGIPVGYPEAPLNFQIKSIR